MYCYFFLTKKKQKLHLKCDKRNLAKPQIITLAWTETSKMAADIDAGTIQLSCSTPPTTPIMLAPCPSITTAPTKTGVLPSGRSEICLWSFRCLHWILQLPYTVHGIHNFLGCMNGLDARRSVGGGLAKVHHGSGGRGSLHVLLLPLSHAWC